MAFYYSKRQCVALAGPDPHLFALISLVLLTALMVFSEASLLLYFGAHHALNEGYLWRPLRTEDARLGRTLSAIRALLHFFLYAFILRHSAELNTVPELFLVFALLLCYALLFYKLLRHARMDWWRLLSYSRFEILALGIAGLSLFIDISFLQMVIYHFILWTLYPLRSIAGQGAGQVLSYAGLTASCLGFFLLLSPLGLFAYSLSNSLFYQQFYLWSYIHISASFALSNANPAWIVSLFRPEKRIW